MKEELKQAIEKVSDKETAENVEKILMEAKENEMLIVISGPRCTTFGKGYELLSMLSLIVGNLKDLGIEKESIERAFDLGFKNTEELQEETKKTVEKLIEKIMNM